MKTLQVEFTVNISGKLEERTAYLSIHDSCAEILQKPKSSLVQVLLQNAEQLLKSACVLQNCMFEYLKRYKITEHPYEERITMQYR